jgi:hypothetical protein
MTLYVCSVLVMRGPHASSSLTALHILPLRRAVRLLMLGSMQAHRLPSHRRFLRGNDTALGLHMLSSLQQAVTPEGSPVCACDAGVSLH